MSLCEALSEFLSPIQTTPPPDWSRLKLITATSSRSRAILLTFFAYIFSSRTAIAGVIIALLFAFTIQRIWIVLGRCIFFKDLFTHFHDLWSQIGVVILVTPKQKMERKSEWFCGVKMFRSNLKVEYENGVWLFFCSGFLFICGNFTLVFTGFFSFLDRMFF